MKKFLTAAFMGLALPSSVWAETSNFNFTDISEIKIKNGSGSVSIVGDDSHTTDVNAIKNKFDENCKLTVEKKKKLLFIEVKNVTPLNNCKVDFNITTPKKVALDFDLGSGNLDIKNTSGDLEFHIGSGIVKVDAEVKDLDGKSGSGDIFIKGLTESGELEVGSGNVVLSYQKVPSSGELEIKVGSGNIELSFPKTTKIRTSFQSGVGTLRNEFNEDLSNNAFKVSLKSGVGNVQIKKN